MLCPMTLASKHRLGKHVPSLLKQIDSLPTEGLALSLIATLASTPAVLICGSLCNLALDCNPALLIDRLLHQACTGTGCTNGRLLDLRAPLAAAVTHSTKDARAVWLVRVAHHALLLLLVDALQAVTRACKAAKDTASVLANCNAGLHC